MFQAALKRALEGWLMTEIRQTAPSLTLLEVAQDTLVMAEAFLAEGGAVIPTHRAIVALAEARMKVLLEDPSVTLEVTLRTGKRAE
jgi:hypothetical protein